MDIEILRKAWEDEGISPTYHRLMQEELRKAWPTLYYAIEKVLKYDV